MNISRNVIPLIAAQRDELTQDEHSEILEVRAARAVRARESRLRRLAQHYGFMLRKSRRRNWQAPDYGTYQLIDPISGGSALGGQWGSTLDEIEDWLEED
jgi:hypothetical protein